MDFKASRWTLLKETSPSGKRLFGCSICGRISVGPDKTCRTFADPEESKRCSRHDDVTIHRYYLPSIKGEGWAVVLIGSDGMFTALSDYGNYGYWWSHHGCKDVREFFLRATKDPDYFVRKLTHGHQDIYDGDATVKDIKKYILEVRRDRSWTAEKARAEWELLDNYEIADSSEGFSRWYDNTRIDEAYEYRHTKPQPQAVAFVEKVMRRLEEVIRLDLGYPEEEKKTG